MPIMQFRFLQYAEGESLTSIWAVRSLGIDPTTGKRAILEQRR